MDFIFVKEKARFVPDEIVLAMDKVRPKVDDDRDVGGASTVKYEADYV